MKNAWKSVTRNKGRNILVIIIVTIIAIAATIGLSIRQAATTARNTGLENTTVTAQISLDREKLISESRNQSNSSESDASDQSGEGRPNVGGMDGGKDFGGTSMVSGDFSLVGFSSDEAVSNTSNGSFTMVDGKVFGYDKSSDGDAIISKSLADFNAVSSADVENYESSLMPLNNLSKFALTLLIVVLAVGGVVLVVITLLNVRERKYEIGVLAAIGVNKVKVAAQFTLELLIVTMIGLALGACAGAVASVPVSNQLLASQIEQQQSQQTNQREQFGRDMQGSADGSGTGAQDSGNANDSSNSTDSQNSDSASNQNSAMPGKGGNGPEGMMDRAVNYASSVNATVNLTVVGQLLLVGLGLTLIAALVAVVFVLRYEPLQILADRS